MCRVTDLDHLRATVGEALEAWEMSGTDGPTPHAAALMADALYSIRERLTDLAYEWENAWLPSTRAHGRRLREEIIDPQPIDPDP